MLAEVFIRGTLELPVDPVPLVSDGALWSGCLFNRIAIAVAIVAVMVDIQDMFDLVPSFKDCLVRARGNIGLEHTVSLARSRNMCAWVMAIPFCLVADRFGLYCSRWMQALPAGWSLAAVMGLLLFFVLLDSLVFLLMRPKRLGGEVAQAVKRCTYTYFIIMTVLILVTVGILALVGAPDLLVRKVIYWEMAGFFLFSLLRSGQILAARFSGLSTILYLCGLKILPVAVIVAGAVIF